MGRECGALQPKDAPALSAKRAWVADPVPEQQPWRFPEDAQGWQRIYRGTGQRRQVKNSVVVGQFAPTSGETSYFSMALTKGSTLTACVNQALEEMKADQTLKAITDEWLSQKTNVGQVPTFSS